MGKNKRRYKRTPPPPVNDGSYILVNAKEGPHWRKRRGSYKEAVLNESFSKNAEATAIVSPATKRLAAKLQPWLANLQTRRLVANVSALLRQALADNHELNYSVLKGYDFQPDFPFFRLFTGSCGVQLHGDEILINIPIDERTIERKNRLVDGYYFEAILLHGDLQKNNSLRVETETSPVYPISERFKAEWNTTMILPAKKRPWMFMMRVACQEEGKPACHPRHYAMQVMLTS
jgi:hypothetical protein